MAFWGHTLQGYILKMVELFGLVAICLCHCPALEVRNETYWQLTPGYASAALSANH